MRLRLTDNAADDIVMAAAALMLKVGVGGLSARVVAQAAGLSPSAVNYHLGGRDGLLRSLCARTGIEFDLWGDERLATLRSWPSEMLSPASVITSLVFDLAGQPWAFALLEFRDMIRRGEANLGDGPDVAWLAMEEFWTKALARFDLDRQRIELWRIFAAGALSLALVDTDLVIRFAWLTESARRLADRVAGWHPLGFPREEAEPADPVEHVTRSDGKQRILEAAIRLIGDNGVDSVTHRRVAAAAGLSLASTTYFFKDKTEIIIEAFRELHWQAIQRIGAPTPASIATLSEVLLTEDGEPRSAVGAMNALYVAAAREDALKPFALSLRRVRGIGSSKWLPARGAKNVDRLDGFIWSLIIGGLFTTSLLIRKTDRAEFLDRKSDQLFNAIYAKP